MAARRERSARHEDVLDGEAGLELDDPHAGGQVDDAGRGQDRLLDDGEDPAGELVGVGAAALGQHGEGTAAHARDDVLAADGGPQPAADLGHDGAHDVAPGVLRAARMPSSSTISRVPGSAPKEAAASRSSSSWSTPARLGSPVMGSV